MRNFLSCLLITSCFGLFVLRCNEAETDLRIRQMAPEQTAQLADSIATTVNLKLADGFTMRLWGIDSLVADPIALDIDDQGRVYYTRANRPKHSEFDIRGHQDWEIPSIQLQSVDDRRAFLRATLAPELSEQNAWLADLNGDGSHDWKDLTVEKEKIYRVDDTDGDGVADQTQLVVEDFDEEVTDVAGAVLVAGDDLFVGVAPDLWRTQDENGDGLADELTAISSGYGVHVGFGGHGMSGLEMGPDGRIYWGIGDIGFNGTGPDGKEWKYPNRGVLVRSNPDGSDFEVFAMGLRNTHEFTFDEYGNLIGQDNDGDHPGESERLVYLVDGSDTGWRINWQFGKYKDPKNNEYKVWMDEKMYVPRWDGQAAYMLPTIKNFVNGPTGFVRNPGTALSPDWRNRFFVASFVGNPARSGIHSFELVPKGAGFELGEHQEVLSGIAATGLDFGPDGALYVGDWIEGWEPKNDGRIWKLDVADGINEEERQQTKDLLAENFSPRSDQELGELLAHNDQRVRQKAQFALVERGKEGAEVFKQVIAQQAFQMARIHSIWGLSQLARQASHYATPLLPLLQDDDPEIRAQAARWLGDMRYADAAPELIPLLEDPYPRARFFAAEALGRIADDSAVQSIIAMLEANNDEDVYLRHAGSLALARIGQSRSVVALAQHPSRAVRLAAVVALRRMQEPGIAEFLDDEDEGVVTEAARAINDDYSIEQALPALGDLLTITSFQNEPLIRRAISANLRVGTEQALQNLIDYAQEENHPLAMRTEALDALGTWTEPSVLDRVTGRDRGTIKRIPEPAIQQAAPALVQLTQNRAPELRRSAARALGLLGADDASPTLLARLKQDPDAGVRIAALEALVHLDNESTAPAVTQALSDSEKQVRAVALDGLADTDLPPEQMTALLSEVIDTRTTEEQQAALLTLGTLPPEHAEPVLANLIQRLEDGKLPVGIQLELADAVDSTQSDALKARLAQVRANASDLTGDALLASYEDCLEGGDPERGRAIAFRNSTAQCMKCHAYDDYGGNAGPRLNGVGSRLSRKQILESLILPSARLAPGYGTVILAMNDGRKISGVLQAEDEQQLTVQVGNQDPVTLRKDEIATRTNAPSSMPSMTNYLTKKQIRDLVSMLATLKQEDV
ncbi:MAG: HEAT repeat domain-containing protein [Tunicatimonas sp.]